jgi:DNA-binding MarR family transcriptional regulator
MKNLKTITAIRDFNRFYTNIIGVVDRHILDSPYSLTEVRVLFEIYHDPNSTARKVKNFLQVDEGYLSRTINKLVKQGLIIRSQSKSDPRSFILSLTRKGEKEFLALNNRSESAVELMIKRLSSNEKNELVSMMHRIQELLEKE